MGLSQSDYEILAIIGIFMIVTVWIFYGDHSRYDDRRMKIKKLREEIKNDIENLK
jgi:hypothetical protein